MRFVGVSNGTETDSPGVGVSVGLVSHYRQTSLGTDPRRFGPKRGSRHTGTRLGNRRDSESEDGAPLLLGGVGEMSGCSVACLYTTYLSSRDVLTPHQGWGSTRGWGDRPETQEVRRRPSSKGSGNDDPAGNRRGLTSLRLVGEGPSHPSCPSL